MFADGHAEASADSDLTPFWVYAPEGGAVIERYVPAAPRVMKLPGTGASCAPWARTGSSWDSRVRRTCCATWALGAAELDWLRIDLTLDAGKEDRPRSSPRAGSGVVAPGRPS